MSIVGRSTQNSSGFSPLSIPDCILWLDAADSNAFTGGTTWLDKSTSSNTAINGTPGSTTMPTVTPWGNGNRAARFVKTSANSMKTTNTIPNLNVTYFMVLRVQEAVAGFIMINNVDGNRQIGLNTSVFPIEVYSHARSSSYISTTLAQSEIYLHTGIIPSSGNYSAYANGMLLGTAPVNNSSSSRHYFGSGDGASGYATIDIAEIIIYGTAVSTVQQQQVEGYLAAKWGSTSSIPVAHPYKTLRPFARPFTPIDIPGCDVWLDGMDTTTFTLSGANITQWADKSGNSRHGAATGTPQAGTTTTGKPAIVMDGTSYFSLSNASTLSGGSTTIFLQASATAGPYSLLAMYANARVVLSAIYWNNSTNFSLSPYTFLNTNGLLTIVENSASNCAVAFNGNAIGTQTYQAATTSSQVIIGAHYTLNNNWIGNIQEVIMYNNALSLGQRQQVEAYLVNKWGTRSATPSTHYAKLAVPLSPIFNPMLMGPCRLWLDALDASTFTLSGSNITTWRDKSGGSNHSTTLINTPTYGSNLINGKPAVFISSNAMRGSISPTISGTQVHCFMVCTPLSTCGDYPRFLGLDDGTNYEYNATTGIEAFGRIAGANFLCSRLNNNATVSVTYNVPNLVTSYNSSSNHYITANGSTTFVSASSGDTGNFAISKWNIGCDTGGSVGWNPQIYIGEILVYAGVISKFQRQQVEGYLVRKWGITSNLPSGHPYKATSTQL